MLSMSEMYGMSVLLTTYMPQVQYYVSFRTVMSCFLVAQTLRSLGKMRSSDIKFQPSDNKGIKYSYTWHSTIDHVGNVKKFEAS